MYRRAICFLEKDQRIVLVKGTGIDEQFVVAPGKPVEKVSIDSITKIYQEQTGLRLLDPILNMHVNIHNILKGDHVNQGELYVFSASKFSGRLSNNAFWLNMSHMLFYPMKTYEFVLFNDMKHYRQKLYMECLGTEGYVTKNEPWLHKGSEQDVLPGDLVQKIQEVQR